MKPDLKRPPKYVRAAMARGLRSADGESVIDRKGGDYGAGLIRGMAVVTRGEALGHDLWLDAAFLDQARAALASARGGVKARFTHPGLSSDGTGKFLGRVKNPRLDGDVLRGDLHLSRVSHNTPDGDLGGYVMDLAEEDPAAFGTSIVFERDAGEEDRFDAEHTDEDGTFTSPDTENSRNLMHARLSRLLADDIVDDPAANPDGLFHRGDEVADEADSLLAYALNLTAERPVLTTLEIDPDRVSGFVDRFLNQHGLCVVPKKEQQMADTSKSGAPAPESKPADTVDLSAERLSALKARYPDSAFVLEMFEGQKSMSDAEIEWQRRENARLTERLAALEKENETLKAAPKTGAAPVAFSGGSTSAPEDFMAAARAYKAEHKCTIGEAMNATCRAFPELYKAHLAKLGL